MNGYNRRYPQYGMPESTSFYSPFSKYPMWGRGFGGMFSNIGSAFAQVKQLQGQREQQKFERDIKEREMAVRERQPKQTRWDFQKQFGQYMEATKQWTPVQTRDYLANNKIPQVPIEVNAETKAGMEQLFGLKDFNQEPPSDQVGYIRTYAIQQQKPEPGKPIPRESIKLKQDRDKLVTPLVERYQGIAKKIDAAIFELGEPGDDPDPKHLQYRRQLHNSKKALDILLYAQSVVDGGDELSPELRKLVRQVSFKTREIQTGKFFASDKFGYVLGETRTGKDGQEYIYLGNDQWLPKL